ncbi:hypothetical protein MPSEU_000702500 [Mayamaea pseudoterrestris]|nr:hypothetical protein MPSEU_000702500 [Mayamaea pseudoterrestris]
MSQVNDTDYLALSFNSFESLQTKLLLMPRDDETGLGAIVTAKDCAVQNHALVGMVDQQTDFYELEFCQILSVIRQANAPFTCRFAPLPAAVAAAIQHSGDATTQEQEEEKKDDSSVKHDAKPDFRQEHNGEVTNHESIEAQVSKTSAVDQLSDNNPDTPAAIASKKDDCSIITKSSSDDSHNDSNHKMQLSSPTWSDLQKWTTRMTKTSMEFSTVAASTAVQMAMAAKERAATASNGNHTQSAESAKTMNEEQALPVNIFIHTSSGAWLPLPKTETNGATGELVLTNSSVISVRFSATEPCLSRNFSFQWYCSCNNSDQKWQILKGATNASFQPCATEVGHRLRCAVQAKDKGETVSVKDPEAEGDIKIYYCETIGRVLASEQLFNGARQALVRGTSFGGLVGKDKATGRSFSIKIQTKKYKDEKGNKASCSAITIYQVSGKTAEPMHPENEPVTGVMACVDYSTPKEFKLVFANGIPQSASMVAALATDNQLTLQSSTRLGRESLLLTLGIANFPGKQSELGPTTMLYDCPSRDPAPILLQYSYDSTVEGDVDCASHGTGSTCTSPMDPLRLGSPERKNRSSPCPSLSTVHSKSSTSRTQERSNSLGSMSILSDSDDSTRTGELEQEVVLLREKLDRKNKVVGDLQRQLAQSEALSAKKEEQVQISARSLQQSENDKQSLTQSLRLAEKKVVTLQESVKIMQEKHHQKVEAVEAISAEKSAKILELEKTIRTLQNDKAVLSAGIEAREGKLARMDELQRSYLEMTSKIRHEEVLRVEIEAASRRCNETIDELEQVKKALVEKESEVERLTNKTCQFSSELEHERKKTASHHADIETLQLRIQKLVAERNNYKQKGDSLSKEMSRICRNGRSIRDVERILIDEASLRQEVVLLREQKRRALEDLDHYRTSYEQSRSAQQMAGFDADTVNVLERNAELERLLAELTEYVQAKEMQLETLMQVNAAIQKELKDLTKSTMSKNLSRHDV